MEPVYPIPESVSCIERLPVRFVIFWSGAAIECALHGWLGVHFSSKLNRATLVEHVCSRKYTDPSLDGTVRPARRNSCALHENKDCFLSVRYHMRGEKLQYVKENIVF